MGKGKKGKKNKQKEAEQKAAKLLELKESRQQTLLNLGNNLMGNLDVKYGQYLTDDIRELWESQILEIVSFYEEDYQNKVEDEETLKSKKDELRTSWDEIFELIQQDYDEGAAQREQEKKERDKLKKLELLRKQCLNIGGGGGPNVQTAASKKARQKREEKEKLKALRARLKEMDKMALKQ